MANVEVYIVAVVFVLLAIGGFLFYYLDDKRRAKRALRRRPTPMEQLGTATERPVTVVGTVGASDGHPIIAVNGQPCVFCHVAVLHLFRRTGSDGAVSEAWKPVGEESHGPVLTVTDGTATVTVDPRGAVLLLQESWYDVDWNGVPPAFQALLDRHERVERGHPTKVRVQTIGAGQRLAVHGTPSFSERTASFAARPGQKLYAVGSAQDPA